MSVCVIKPIEMAPFFNYRLLLFVVDAENTLVGPVGPFKSTLILTVFTPNRQFLRSE